MIGFRVSGLGFWVSGLRLKALVPGLRLRVGAAVVQKTELALHGPPPEQ